MLFLLFIINIETLVISSVQLLIRKNLFFKHHIKYNIPIWGQDITYIHLIDCQSARSHIHSDHFPI